MCGIAGFVSKKNNSKKTIKNTLSVLKSLEYRGYDSSGIAYKNNDEIKIVKSVGKIDDLIKKIDIDNDALLAISHTRWATHGEVNEKNSHPHFSNNVTLVHNGIIENYIELKKELEKKGYEFYSNTDTEIVAKLIDYNYSKIKNKIEAISLSLKEIVGSYALAIIFNDSNDIYVAAKNSPIVICDTNEGCFVSSDINSIPISNAKFYFIDDKTIGVLNDSITFYDFNSNLVNIEPQKINNENNIATKDGYETFMLKEINDQPKLIDQIINKYIVENQIIFNLSDELISKLKKTKFVRLIGCGTAFNVGALIQEFILNILEIKSEVVIASEFKYQKFIKMENTLNIVISQSGETADTISALRLAKQNDEFILSITNNKFSTISNESDFNIDMNCGIESSVASTKAYTVQCILLHLFIYYWKSLLDKNTNNQEIIDQLKIANENAKKILAKNNIDDYIEKIINANNVFFIGKCINYALSNEASLKFKEITYINSCSFASGELKHGSISLIDDKTYVIGIFSNDSSVINEKTNSNMKETKSRGAKNIFIGSDKISEFLDDKDILLTIGDKTNEFSYISVIYIFQLLAYYSAKKLGNDIDYPRNLAKSVTVE